MINNLNFILRELRTGNDSNCSIREYIFNYDDDLQLEHLIEDKYNEYSVH